MKAFTPPSTDPQGRWVEVQIRTRRMDLVAEKGLAAHWRYKGLKGREQPRRMDEQLRDILETADRSAGADENMSMDIYSDEVFVFTPKAVPAPVCPKAPQCLISRLHIHTKVGLRMYRRTRQRQNRKMNFRLNSGRHRRDKHLGQPKSQSGLAEFHRDLQGAHKDTPGAQRRPQPSGHPRQRDADAQA